MATAILQSDVELMLLVRESDGAAFEELFRRHRLSLTAFFRKLCREADFAEDLFQETFLRLWTARERYEPTAKFASYLYTVARNVWYNERGRRARRPAEASGEAPPGQDRLSALELARADERQLPEAVLEARELRRRLDECLDGIDEKLRTVFVLSHFGGLKYAQISQQLHVPVGTVKYRLDEAFARAEEYATRELEAWAGGEPNEVGHLRLWLRRAGLMLDSGVSLLQTLEVSVEGDVPERLREAVLFVGEAVRSGSTLSAALAEHVDVFPPTVRGMVRAGERSGTLDEVALQTAEHLHAGVPLPAAGKGSAKTTSVGEPAPDADGAGAWEAAIRRLDEMLLAALDAGATDLPLQPGRSESRARMRVDGVLRAAGVISSTDHLRYVNWLKARAGLALPRRAEPNRGAARLRLGQHDRRCRVSTYPTLYGEAVALRFHRAVDPAVEALEQPDALAPLGLRADQAAIVDLLLRQPNGILLVAGPAGSGRTTMLHCLARAVAGRGAAVFAVEEAVEAELPGIRQVKLEPELGLDIVNALRAANRQDPALLVLGVPPDEGAWPLVVEMANTGHYVMLPWQAQDAAAALLEATRAIGDPVLAAGTLVGATAQRLVRRPCPACAAERELTDLERDQVPAGHPLLQSPRTVESRGCEECGYSGTAGRYAIFETARVEGHVRRQMSGDSTGEALRLRLREAGVSSLRWEALLRVAAQQLTVTEALRATPADGAGTV